MDAAKARRALKQADMLIIQISTMLSTVEMDSDTRATLELEFLRLRIQVEIARKEIAIYEHHRCSTGSPAAAV